MIQQRAFRFAVGAVVLVLVLVLVWRMAVNAGSKGGGTAVVASARSMLDGRDGRLARELFTVGESLPGVAGAGNYSPPGILDGLGAFALDADTVRLLANHELGITHGYAYEVGDGAGGSFTLSGARISFFDIDRTTREIVAAGLAYDTIYDANGDVAADNGFLANNAPGLSRLCSGGLIEAHAFGSGRGLENRIYFAGEESGGGGSPVGGGEWGLDPETGHLWHLPALGRGAWENIAVVDTGTTAHIALLLGDDTAPFNADGDAAAEAAPLYLYVGEKEADGDFPAQNGLRGGKLYVWVADSGERTPLDFNGTGSLAGAWVEIDNSPQPGQGSENGATGFDEFGYPTQRTLWSRADAVGAFGFSRPEDVAVNPADGAVVVLASTGVAGYAVDPSTGNGADSFGTVYAIASDFTDVDNPTAVLTILYDGDADPTRALRSPDNLDWADDGYIYVQEDEAVEITLTGEPLFGPGAANPSEAGIVRLDPATGDLRRIGHIDRSVVLDPTVDPETAAVDRAAGEAGEWESSGIVDVATLFGAAPGTLFLLNVQAHGIVDQGAFNPTSRLVGDDLVEGGQLIWLFLPEHAAYLPGITQP